MGSLQKDTQYKIRETVIETLGKLGVAYGIDAFKTYIESFFFNYITDTVSNVREVGVRNLDVIKFVLIFSDACSEIWSCLDANQFSS